MRARNIFLLFITTIITICMIAQITNKNIQIRSTTLSNSLDYEYKIYNEIPATVVETITGASYPEGGPISLSELTYLKVAYWGFDDKKHLGEMIIHKDLAREVVEIFRELYEAKFPITKMRLIDYYQAEDKLSMEDNNTYAFCVRFIEGSQIYSKHSYGIAIDLNPVQNPYVRGEKIEPKEGIKYVNRDKVRKGMIVRGDSIYNAFVKRGWIWGGDWFTLKDYQHFEKKTY